MPANPLVIKDGKLTDSKTGKSVQIKGISWFGFNNKATMVDGLWAGGAQAASDFAMIVYQYQLFGFNTIRLPFVFEDMELPAKAQDRNCVFTRDEALKARTIDPNLVESKQQPAAWHAHARSCCTTACYHARLSLLQHVCQITRC
jgi:hypothetical protein